jgi:hypothetical protein
VSDRSDELRRQRDLLREHLAWLEREMAKEAGMAPDEGEPRPLAPRINPPRISVTASDADRDAEAILAEFRRSSPAIEQQTKRGCILYFAIIVSVLLAVALGLAYFYTKSRR